MSITSVSSNTALVNPVAPQPKPAPQKPVETQTNSSLESLDQVEFKKGAMPSLKGAGAGALTAGGTAVALFTILSKGKPFAGEGAIVSVPLAMAAALGGAVGGAVSANYTDSKGKGALIGGLAGAGVGAAALAVMNLKDGPAGMLSAALSGAVVGGLTGSVGGVGGAFVAKHQ